MILGLFIISVVISVIINAKKKINIGITSAVFAYLIGCWIMGLKPAKVMSFTPTNILFQLGVIAMLFSFPKQNGSMDKLCGNIIYCFRNTTYLLPFALWACYYLICFMGASAFAGLLIFGFLSFKICETTKISPLVAATASLACVAGGQFPWSSTGAIVTGYIAEHLPAQAESIDIKIAIFSAFFSLIVLTLVSFATGAFKKHEIAEIKKPEPLDSRQKKNLILIVIIIAIVLLTSLLKALLPGSVLIKTIATYSAIQMLALVGVFISIVMGFGDEKTAITQGIPWNTVVLMAGMSLLMGVAKQAGTFDMIANHIATKTAPWMIAPLFAILAGILTMFADGIVTMQLLIGIAAPVVAMAGVSPVAVFTGIVLGARFCASSPFSSWGAMTMGLANENDRDTLFRGLIAVTAVFLVFSGVFTAAIQLIL